MENVYCFNSRFVVKIPSQVTPKCILYWTILTSKVVFFLLSSWPPKPDALLSESASFSGNKKEPGCTASSWLVPALSWGVETSVWVSHPCHLQVRLPGTAVLIARGNFTLMAQFVGVLLPRPLVANICSWLKLKPSVTKSNLKALVPLSELCRFWSFNLNQV